ncbi:MAG TPA: hypothetical protein VGG34_08780 [Opitutaceae bacterium]|jgi:hypothetical protein
MKKLFLMLCVVIGLYKAREFLQERTAAKSNAAFIASRPGTRPASQFGFKDILPLDGVDPRVVTVLTPYGCPLEAGKRGRALIAKIKAANIPVTASSEAHASVKGSSREEMEAKIAALNSVMSGETPIVLYKGRAVNNPSFEAVLAEYQASR